MTVYKRRQSQRIYGLSRFALDEGGGIFDANTNNGIFDSNRHLDRNYYGIFHGSPTWGHDAAMGTFLRTSTNNYIEGFASALFMFATVSFSVSIWLRCTGTGDNYPALVGHRQSAGGVGSKGWSIHMAAGSPYGVIYAEISDGTTAPVTYDTSFPPANNGLWHNAVLIVDRLKNVMIMVYDNIWSHSTSIVGLGSLATDGTGSLKIGFGPPSGISAFTGSLARLDIFEYVLSRGEISRMYYERQRTSSRFSNCLMSSAGGSAAAVALSFNPRANKTFRNR